MFGFLEDIVVHARWSCDQYVLVAGHAHVGEFLARGIPPFDALMVAEGVVLDEVGDAKGVQDVRYERWVRCSVQAV